VITVIDKLTFIIFYIKIKIEIFVAKKQSNTN